MARLLLDTDAPALGTSREAPQRLPFVDELKVSRIHVDEGQSLRRFSARAKGRGVRIEKQTCHIYLTVGTGKAQG